MCGRYNLYDVDDLEKRFEADLVNAITPNFNAAPTQDMPVVVVLDGQRYLHSYHWGIPRVLGKDTVKELINTRSDKAFGGFWKKNVQSRRCIVPANSFYEWKKTDRGKVPYIIGLPDRSLIGFAGIWSEWESKSGNKFSAYSIMTTDANEEMKDVHDRMPVILYADQEADWLDAETSPDRLAEILVPSEDGRLLLEEGSQAINNVRTNERSLITPVNSK